MVLLFKIVTLIVLCSSTGLAEIKKGPYNFKITDFRACDDTGKNEIAFDIITEYEGGDKERPCFSGNVSLSRDFDDSLTYKIQVEILQDESWKTFLNLVFKKGCNDVKSYERNWFKLLNTINITATDCPVPKGFYSFKCVNFRGQTFQSHKTLVYGRYRAFKSLWDKDTLVGCHYAEALVTPAPA